MSKTVMMRAIGAADVLQIEDVQISAPKKNEVQISVHAIGLNRAEIMSLNLLFLLYWVTRLLV